MARKSMLESYMRKRLRRRALDVWNYLFAAHLDFRLWLTGKTDRELPPLRLRFVGMGDFRAIGEEMVGLLVRYGGLGKSDRVLDIGSGIGRVAIPLTRYLESTYDGFDIVRSGVRWCQRHITPRHPNFRFHLIDVRSTEYGGRGGDASRFRFPFGDASFDFVIATSLFTHLLFDETRQYLREAHRVLAPGGRLFATFFLLDDFAKPKLPSREPRFRFPYADGALRYHDASNPAAGVAIEQSAAFDLIRDAGFAAHEIHYGTWCERPGGVSFQDVVVCTKAAPR
jgi:SAM-dependent methyltransferase